jgi:hypothetical protein
MGMGCEYLWSSLSETRVVGWILKVVKEKHNPPSLSKYSCNHCQATSYFFLLSLVSQRPDLKHKL